MSMTTSEESAKLEGMALSVEVARANLKRTTRALPEHPLVSIRPSRKWVSLNLRDIWAYRELLYFLTWRDVKVRYKQTLLGAAWAIIQPLSTMLIFTLFFGKMAKVPSDGILIRSSPMRDCCPGRSSQTRSSQRQQPGRKLELDHQSLFPRMVIPGAAVAAGWWTSLSLSDLDRLMIYYGVALP